MSLNRMVCTGYNKRTHQSTHQPRRVATYVLVDDGFSVQGPRGAVGITVEGLPGTRMYSFRCPSCTLDMRFSADNLEKFLRAPGAPTKDVSLLASIVI